MNRHKEILDKIIANRNETSLVSSASSVKNKDDIDKMSIFSILSLNKNRFSEEGIAIIETLEQDNEFPYQDLYKSLKWKLICLTNIQDVLSGAIYDHVDKDVMGSRNYFFYEGLHLLREYFYCGFNNYLSAAEHLLRTFVEFNIKQCYFEYVCEKQNSFIPLKEYFKNGVSISALKMSNKFLPQDEISKPVKKRIQMLLKSLSNKSSHAYKPIDSIRGSGKLRHEYSVDTIVFWMNLNSSLTTVLWSYFITKPALFNPKDIPRKFGFSPPMGIFISDFQYQAVVNSLSPEDLKIFKEYAMQTNEIKVFNKYYENQKDLTDDEIWETFNGEKLPESISDGYVVSLIKMRTMVEMLSSLCTFDAQKDIDESLEPLLYKLSDYSWWKDNYLNLNN